MALATVHVYRVYRKSLTWLQLCCNASFPWIRWLTELKVRWFQKLINCKTYWIDLSKSGANNKTWDIRHSWRWAFGFVELQKLLSDIVLIWSYLLMTMTYLASFLFSLPTITYQWSWFCPWWVTFLSFVVPGHSKDMFLLVLDFWQSTPNIFFSFSVPVDWYKCVLVLPTQLLGKVVKT